MESYHLAWLRSHPYRTEEWLAERLADGFQIHHVDGNHDNDDPLNLLLVDGTDHLRLHAGSIKAGIENWRQRQRAQTPKVDPIADEEGRKVYFRRAADARSWREFAEEYHGGQKPEDRIWSDIGVTLQAKAKSFARRNNLPWPPQTN